MGVEIVKARLAKHVGATMPEVKTADGTVLFHPLKVRDDEILLDCYIDPGSGARVFQTVPVEVFEQAFGEAFDDAKLAAARGKTAEEFRNLTASERAAARKAHLDSLNKADGQDKGYGAFIAKLLADGTLTY